MALVQNLNSNSKKLIIIVGPTAVGKTVLGVRLAQHYRTEVLSADSRQFYREMAIGTAKPTSDEMQGVPHHFVDSLSVTDVYNAGDFERDALALLEKLFEKNDIVVVVGGSGMYVKALCEGLDDMPEHDEELREQLNNEALVDYQSFLCKLQTLDPVYYEQVDKANLQRVVRAVEVCVATGKPFSSYRKAEKKERPFEVYKFGLERDRDELYNLIDMRMDQMLATGLFEEAKALYKYKDEYALQTIGYSEIYGFLDGVFDCLKETPMLNGSTLVKLMLLKLYWKR
jgi:tRNA dimethylallyltransferase